MALTENSEETSHDPADQLRSEIEEILSTIVESCNTNFLELETTTSEVAHLTKEMIDVSRIIVKKMAEFSSSKLDATALEAFFEYVNNRVGMVGRVHCRTLSDTKENQNSTGKFSLRKVRKNPSELVLNSTFFSQH